MRCLPAPARFLPVIVLFLWGCQPAPQTQVPPSAAPITNAFAQGMGVVAALAGPLVPNGSTLHRDRLVTTEAEGRTAIENGVSGNSVVTDPPCVGYAWAWPTVTITFTGCVLEATGESIDGSLSLTVGLNPVRFTLTFASLQVGANGFDGSFTVAFSGLDGAPSVGIDGNLTFATPEGATTFTVTGLTLQSSVGAITANGIVGLSGATTSTLTLEGITIRTGDCLPSAGWFRYMDGTSRVTITFLATTPSTGAVEVQVGAFPPVTTALIPPC